MTLYRCTKINFERMSDFTTALVTAFCVKNKYMAIKIILFSNPEVYGICLMTLQFPWYSIKQYFREMAWLWLSLRFYLTVLLLPVTCVALARVKIKALLSSSDSAERTVLGSLRNRVNCGWTSELPKAVISLRAVLSTLKEWKQSS